jgi:hypothetical protein
MSNICSIDRGNIVQKHTTMKTYNTVALQTFLCGSLNWTMKAKDKPSITTAEKKFMRRTENTLG